MKSHTTRTDKCIFAKRIQTIGSAYDRKRVAREGSVANISQQHLTKRLRRYLRAE